MITIGNLEISDISVGSAAVSEVWVGNQLVWPTFRDFLTDEAGNILSGMDPQNTYGSDTQVLMRVDAFERVKGVKYKVDQSKCIGCGACVDDSQKQYCIYLAFTVNNGVYDINSGKCVGCGACVNSICPVNAIVKA